MVQEDQLTPERPGQPLAPARFPAGGPHGAGDGPPGVLVRGEDPVPSPPAADRLVEHETVSTNPKKGPPEAGQSGQPGPARQAHTVSLSAAGDQKAFVRIAEGAYTVHGAGVI